MKKMEDNLKGFMFPRLASNLEYRKASGAISKYKKILSDAGVDNYVIGTRYSKPYILVLIEEGKTGNLPNSIPDTLEGFEVFYREFSSRK